MIGSIVSFSGWRRMWSSSLKNLFTVTESSNNATIISLSEAVGVENKYNVFRKDEVKNFEDKEALMANAPEKERNMFKIPKVIQ